MKSIFVFPLLKKKTKTKTSTYFSASSAMRQNFNKFVIIRLFQSCLPPEPVVGRSSSQPWPTQCIQDTVPPPALLQPPCQEIGPAESGPAGLPWPY